jgi:hypothetical protein
MAVHVFAKNSKTVLTSLPHQTAVVAFILSSDMICQRVTVIGQPATMLKTLFFYTPTEVDNLFIVSKSDLCLLAMHSDIEEVQYYLTNFLCPLKCRVV